MKKIRLDPDALEVLSFSVAEDGAARPGTIQAHALVGYAGLDISYSCLRPCRPRTIPSDCDAC